MQAPLVLEEIITPDAPSMFPLAYGWYLLALIIVVTLALLVLGLYVFYRRTKIERAAKKQFSQSLKTFINDADDQAYIRRNLKIIKQVCALKQPQALSLSGQELAQFLNQSKPCFSDASIFALTQGLYQKPKEEKEQKLELHKLHKDCCNWLKHIRRHS